MTSSLFIVLSGKEHFGKIRRMFLGDQVFSDSQCMRPTDGLRLSLSLCLFTSLSPSVNQNLIVGISFFLPLSIPSAKWFGFALSKIVKATSFFRTDSKLRLKGVPTLLNWHEPEKRLVEENLQKLAMVQLLLSDDWTLHGSHAHGVFIQIARALCYVSQLSSVIFLIYTRPILLWFHQLPFWNHHFNFWLTNWKLTALEPKASNIHLSSDSNPAARLTLVKRHERQNAVHDISEPKETIKICHPKNFSVWSHVGLKSLILRFRDHSVH